MSSVNCARPIDQLSITITHLNICCSWLHCTGVCRVPYRVATLHTHTHTLTQSHTVKHTYQRRRRKHFSRSHAKNMPRASSRHTAAVRLGRALFTPSTPRHRFHQRSYNAHCSTEHPVFLREPVGGTTYHRHKCVSRRLGRRARETQKRT